MISYCSDDFGYSSGDVTRKPEEQARTLEVFAAKNNGVLLPASVNYLVFTGEAKDNYSVDINGKIAEIVSNQLDVESSWNAFIEENRALWEPLEKALNETYYK